MNWINSKKKTTQFGAWKTQPGKESSATVDRSVDYFKAGSPRKFKMVWVSTRKHFDESVAKNAELLQKLSDEPDTRFGYQTDMVKTHDEVQKENQ
jgi:hypothetical protein